MVRRRQVRVVIDRDRVLAEPARGLDQDDDVAGLQGGQHDLAAGSGCRSTNSSPGAGPQVSVTASFSSAGSVSNQSRYVGGRDAHRIARELLRGQPFLVLTTGRDERVDERVAGGGVRFLALDGLERGSRDPAGSPTS